MHLRFNNYQLHFIQDFFVILSYFILFYVFFNLFLCSYLLLERSAHCELSFHFFSLVVYP